MSIDNRPYYVYGVNGSTSQYRMGYSDSSKLLRDLIRGTVSGYANVEFFTSGVNSSASGFFQNLSDYIIDLKFFPLDMSVFVDGQIITSSFISIGKKALPQSDYDNYGVVNWKPYVLIKQELEFTRHFNTFLDFSPYTKIKLYIPFFDLIEIDTVYAYTEKFDVYMAIDTFSGDLSVFIYGHTSGKLFETKTTKVAVTIPIGKTNAEEQQRNQLLSQINYAFAVGSSGLNPSNFIKSTGSLVTQTLQNNVLRLSSYGGSSGGRNDLSVDKSAYVIIERPKDVKYPNRSLKGGVCEDNLLLNSITGYTEIGNINFNPSNNVIYDDEISEIIQLLRDGVIL